MVANSSRKAPRTAFSFEAPFRFSGEMPEGAADQPPPPQPIYLLARSPQPLDHWFWGRIVHDMTGMTPQGDRIQLDWCHDCDENLGFLDKFAADEKAGLQVSGMVVPFEDDDKASEVLHKGRAGVPYQASIDWSGPGLLLEEVGAGMSVEVNGYTFEGPGVVVRKWPLTSVALCPYGYDSQTNAQFADRGERPAELEVKLFTKGPTMDSNAQKNGNADDLRKQFSGELKKFTERFGAENGTKWFTDGKSFTDALELHCQVLDAKLLEKDKTIEEQAKKLSAVKLGETDGVSQVDGDATQGKKKFADLIRMKK